MFNPRAKKGMGFLGFLGFLGLLGYLLDHPDFYLFFAFFGFFAFYWEGRLNKEKPDERLKSCYTRAQTIAFRVGMSISWGTLILLTQFSLPYKTKYSVLVIAISLAFALSVILVPMLTYRYDKKG
ncbi:DUF3796 domain-containing protein [Enterococcus sp. AZ109]|uniref:DUF3796 domain-containing protein n=1 Tax=Enterococcus sp. AZ109 TaxID=2774634 RepID=UPI003F27C4B0